jgi:hypothetical protein
MENSRKGKISEEKHVDPRVRVQVDIQETDRSQKSIEGVAPIGRNTNGHEHSDVIDQIILRLDMRAALPQGARSPKSRGTKADPGGKGTALRHKVEVPRQVRSKRKPGKQVQRKRHLVKKDV